MKEIKKDMKPFFILGGIFLAAALVLFLSTTIIPQALVNLSQASSSGSVSVSSSYVLGQKLLAVADGEDACVVNVFLLDKNGRGVAGKSVEMTGMEGITKLNDLSDEKGMITFAMKSSVNGQFKLMASYNGVELPQTVTVTFRK